MMIPYLFVPALFSIFLVLVCLFVFTMEIRYNFSEALLKRYNIEPEWSVFASKVAGMAIFGLLPLCLLSFTDISPADIGFSTGKIKEFKGVTALILMGILTLSYLISTLKNVRSGLLKVNPKEYSTRNMIRGAAGWIIYLSGYELLFRGILWFTCYSAFGFIPALIINLVLYSLAHYQQGLLPMIGSVPAGIVFCIMANMSGSFILPFIAHTTMAISFEVFSVMQQNSLSLKSEIRNDR
ncbi:MAG TPA: CPBP family intramembrane glutamic endopeptidase [Bacteroidales bacterium]|nr:CPBP family intramembrane glutamic endopeptidase [Bacteroidales bacterium]